MYLGSCLLFWSYLFGLLWFLAAFGAISLTWLCKAKSLSCAYKCCGARWISFSLLFKAKCLPLLYTSSRSYIQQPIHGDSRTPRIHGLPSKGDFVELAFQEKIFVKNHEEDRLYRGDFVDFAFLSEIRTARIHVLPSKKDFVDLFLQGF